jgi:hypothetical protein
MGRTLKLTNHMQCWRQEYWSYASNPCTCSLRGAEFIKQMDIITFYLYLIYLFILSWTQSSWYHKTLSIRKHFWLKFGRCHVSFSTMTPTIPTEELYRFSQPHKKITGEHFKFCHDRDFYVNSNSVFNIIHSLNYVWVSFLKLEPFAHPARAAHWPEVLDDRELSSYFLPYPRGLPNHWVNYLLCHSAL